MPIDRETAEHADPEGNQFRIAVRLLAAALLVYLIYVIVSPFLSIFVWSAVLTVTFYPVFEWLAARLGGRRKLAAAALTLLGFLIVVGPISWLAVDLIEVSTTLVERLDAGQSVLPSLPDTIRRWLHLPPGLSNYSALLSDKLHSALAPLLPDLQPLGAKLLAMTGSAGAAMVNFLTAVVAMGFFFLTGPSLVKAARQLARKIDAAHGEGLMTLAGATIHAISISVIGTSLLEAVLAGVGMSYAGLPGASLLTLAILIFGIIQLGPMIVVIPVTIWAWSSLPVFPSLALTVCMGAVAFVDMVLKPYFLSRGVASPALLSIIGVFGGMIAYGVTGLFIGPIVLAVGWSLAGALLEERAQSVSEG
jgi:predicted PurR-regulated permease PerM